jgi:hypothetical protein
MFNMSMAAAFPRPFEVFPLYIPYYTAVPHSEWLKLCPAIPRWAADQAGQVCYLLIDLFPLISRLEDHSGDNPTTTRRH